MQEQADKMRHISPESEKILKQHILENKINDNEEIE
jgi:hypothetical protein